LISAKSFLTVSGAILEEQKNFQKAEMKALQAQITPHFLYNTFDTIVWLAEEEKTDEVVRITKAFSDFLRISLSRGHEWITIGQELDHIKNYLTIQKIRYADILNYKIEADESLLNQKMIKLVLQPLVENAIYHGIKNKRGRGELSVSVKYADEGRKKIRFSVKDNGAGFTPERLAEVRLELALTISEKLNSVYGLYNVNKKLKLYYGEQTDGLVIESEAGKGGEISFVVPGVSEAGGENV
jgi:two-component system sensor histidine kinase YesM